MRNVHFFPESFMQRGLVSVQVWSPSRSKGEKNGGDPGLSPHAHHHCPQLRAYDIEAARLYLTVPRLGVEDKWAVFDLWCFLPPPAPLTRGREVGTPRDGQDFSPSLHPPLKLLGPCGSWDSDATFCFSFLLVSHLIVTDSCVRGLQDCKKLPKGGPGLRLSESACICVGSLLSTPFSMY